jgi:hypothetical protein
MKGSINSIIKRAIANGFDLTSIENYDPKIFTDKLYDYLVKNKYLCMLENSSIIVADYSLEDIAEITIDGYHLNLVPLKTEGFFDILMEVFRFIADNQNLKPEEEISTEEEKPSIDEVDSEDFDWI